METETKSAFNRILSRLTVLDREFEFEFELIWIWI